MLPRRSIWRWWIQRLNNVRRVVMTAIAMSIVAIAAVPAPNDPGQDLFERRCSGCHSLDTHKEGPRLRGVFGRRAGSATGYEYSAAVKKLDFAWDEALLDRWLTDPDAMAPGTNMEFAVSSADERKAIIGFLKSLAESKATQQ